MRRAASFATRQKAQPALQSGGKSNLWGPKYLFYRSKTAKNQWVKRARAKQKSHDSTGSQPVAIDPSDLPPERRVEAVLFLAKEVLSLKRICDLAELEDATEARTRIKELNEYYDSRQRAFHIKRLAGGYQMMTRPLFSKWIRRLNHVPQPSRLSTPASETLAVVAYRQPVTKAEVESIRGVSCGEMIRQLMEKELVKICGRSDDLGRPFLYATTKEFLKLFGLASLNELPEAKTLRIDPSKQTSHTWVNAE